MSSISMASFALWLTLIAYAFGLPTESVPLAGPESLEFPAISDSLSDDDVTTEDTPTGVEEVPYIVEEEVVSLAGEEVEEVSEDPIDKEWLKESLCNRKLYCILVGINQDLLGTDYLPHDNSVQPDELLKRLGSKQGSKQGSTEKPNFPTEDLELCAAAYVRCPLSDTELASAYHMTV